LYGSRGTSSSSVLALFVRERAGVFCGSSRGAFGTLLAVRAPASSPLGGGTVSPQANVRSSAAMIGEILKGFMAFISVRFSSEPCSLEELRFAQ